MARATWLIVGTVPTEFAVHRGPCELVGQNLVFAEKCFKISRGTPALVAACLAACAALACPAPELLLVGDKGSGEGSRKLYQYLTSLLQSGADFSGLTFHYLYPDVDAHNRILMALENCAKRPCLVADAGFMYVAKMSGYASSYDLFTPDLGELAFLADEKAPHPFYTRGFLLAEENALEEHLKRAYAKDNAARYLIVKGRHDAIVRDGQILSRVSEPCLAAMEAIGGTGDLITGLVTALLASGLNLEKSAQAACQVARLAGLKAKVTPATAIAEFIPHLAPVLKEVLAKL
ncbi:MAG: sugar kinase [Desulfovibrio sp.]|nr:sugar kinase [Desulfovibrio sp.]